MNKERNEEDMSFERRRVGVKREDVDVSWGKGGEQGLESCGGGAEGGGGIRRWGGRGRSGQGFGSISGRLCSPFLADRVRHNRRAEYFCWWTGDVHHWMDYTTLTL